MYNNFIKKTYRKTCGKHVCNFKRHLMSTNHQKKLSSQLPFHNDKKECKMYECLMCKKMYNNLKIHE